LLCPTPRATIQEKGEKVVRLKKPILACAVLLGAAMGLLATPVCPTTTPTVTVTYAELESLGSCTIGDKTFSDFTYRMGSSGSAPVPASDVTVTTMNEGPSAIGFLFGVDLSAGPGQSNDIGIGYTVNGPDMTDATMTMAGGVAPLSNITGSATIAEIVCPGHVISGCAASLPLSVYNINGIPPNTTNTCDFGMKSGVLVCNEGTPIAVNTLGVLKDVNVIGGTGSASISLFTDTVSQGAVPEPGFYGVLAGGMGAIVMFARRRKKNA
jgi:hypothetical protein